MAFIIVHPTTYRMSTVCAICPGACLHNALPLCRCITHFCSLLSLPTLLYRVRARERPLPDGLSQQYDKRVARSAGGGTDCITRLASLAGSCPSYVSTITVRLVPASCTLLRMPASHMHCPVSAAFITLCRQLPGSQPVPTRRTLMAPAACMFTR